MKRPNPTIPKAQATANETAVRTAYTENAKKIATLIERVEWRLQLHLGTFEDSLRAGRTDWGYVGDLGHVATLMTEIRDFLGGKE
jgi:hypothetical protein